MDKREQLKQLEEELKNFVIHECEIFSRVTGYYRPIKQFNPGKQEEFKQREKYDESVKSMN